jgi:hypothetical protein
MARLIYTHPKYCAFSRPGGICEACEAVRSFLRESGAKIERGKDETQEEVRECVLRIVGALGGEKNSVEDEDEDEELHRSRGVLWEAWEGWKGR